MLPKSEPLPRYELTIQRDSDRFTKVDVVELASRQGFFTLGTEAAPPRRSFYYEIWSRPPWWQVWRSPNLLFRGTGHDPLGMTIEYPAEQTRHVVRDPGPDAEGEVVEETESDFQRADAPRDVTQTFLLIVPHFDGDTRLKLFSRDFANAFNIRDGLPAAEIDLP